MTGAELKIQIGMELHAKFEEEKKAVYAYVNHVFAGGDPATSEDGKSLRWSNNPATSHARRVVNAYREQTGIPANPFYPWVPAYNAFDALLEHGDWMPSSDLRDMMRNAMVESELMPNVLREAGWELDKTTIKNKVHYKLVKVADGA